MSLPLSATRGTLIPPLSFPRLPTVSCDAPARSSSVRALLLWSGTRLYSSWLIDGEDAPRLLGLLCGRAHGTKGCCRRRRRCCRRSGARRRAVHTTPYAILYFSRLLSCFAHLSTSPHPHPAPALHISITPNVRRPHTHLTHRTTCTAASLFRTHACTRIRRIELSLYPERLFECRRCRASEL